MNMIKNFLLPMLIVMMLITVGCDKIDGGGDKGTTEPKSVTTEQTQNPPTTNHNQRDPKLPPNPPPSKSTNESTAKELKIKVYYPDENGLRLIGVNRQIKIESSEDKYKAAVEQAMTPPKEKELTSTFKDHSSLISVKVKDGIATVNFDKKIKNGFSGGSTGEEFLVGSVVNTLTEFKEVKKVKFLIDGKEIESLAGHVDLSLPIERMNNLINS